MPPSLGSAPMAAPARIRARRERWARRALSGALAVAGAVAAILTAGGPAVTAQTDLDAFMRQVLAKRDENWKKQQQYVLDERVNVDMRGPGKVLLWGERRDYTWYIRDGFFVRSPVKVNGVTISESD